MILGAPFRAISYAREGFPVSARLAGFAAAMRDELAQQAEVATLFLPGGKPVRASSQMRNAALADTLHAIAERGWSGFCEGWVAAEMERFSHDAGGFFGQSDVARQRASWGALLAGTYRDVTIYNTPLMRKVIHLMTERLARTEDVAAREGLVTGPWLCEQVAAEQVTRGFVEQIPALPVMGQVWRGLPRQLVMAELQSLPVFHADRLHIHHVLDRDDCRNLVAYRLRLRRRLQKVSQSAALVCFDVGKGDVAQLGQLCKPQPCPMRCRPERIAYFHPGMSLRGRGQGLGSARKPREQMVTCGARESQGVAATYLLVGVHELVRTGL